MFNSVFLSVSDFVFEKIAYFGHFELVQDDADGFLWLRIYSVWTSRRVIFSHCRERCSASDRVDCQVRSLVSCTLRSFRVSNFKAKTPGMCFLERITLSFEDIFWFIIPSYRWIFLRVLRYLSLACSKTLLPMMLKSKMSNKRITCVADETKPRTIQGCSFVCNAG